MDKCLFKGKRQFLIIVGVFTTLFTVVKSQPVFEDQQKEKVIAHNIVSQTTWDHNFEDGKFSKKGIKTSYIKYDKKGNIIETVTYKLQDILSHEEYKYNNEGKRTDYIKKRGVVIAYQKSSKYDENGNLTREYGFDGSSKFNNTYEYGNNNKLKQISYFIEDKLKEKRVFEHEGNISNITVYNSSGTALSYVKLRYDKNENVIEETVYDNNKNLVEKKLYVHNSDNKVISEVKYRGEEFYYKLTFLYNSNGDLTNIDEENPNEGRFLKKKFSYDGKDNLTEMLWRRDSNDKFSSRTYTYDNEGICIQYETYYPQTKFRVLTKLTYESD